MKEDGLFKEAWDYAADKDFYCKCGPHGPSKKFIIPVNGMTKEEAEDAVIKLMKDYKENINWDETIELPDSFRSNFSKDYSYDQIDNSELQKFVE